MLTLSLLVEFQVPIRALAIDLRLNANVLVVDHNERKIKRIFCKDKSTPTQFNGHMHSNFQTLSMDSLENVVEVHGHAFEIVCSPEGNHVDVTSHASYWN